VGRAVAVLTAVVVACALAASAGAQKRAPLQHVTIFGDSVAAALNWDPTARDVLAKSNRLTLELAACGRLWTTGCFSPPPPSVLQEVHTLGHKVGPTAIVLVGYNDDPHVYAEGIDKVLHAMRGRGVTQVLWLTLRPVYKQYRITNEVIRGASRRFSWMKVVDWGKYSMNHPAWFGSDGIHFNGTGAVAFAEYLHRTLKEYGLTGPISSNAG
jgi:hypothetical protein